VSHLIPHTDLAREYERLGPELEAAALTVLREQRFILGPRVSLFEEDFRRFLVPEAPEEWAAVGVSSGTDALLLALLDAGVGPGDEVITTAVSFVASAEVIRRVGATPVFVDVEPDTLSLSVPLVEAAITPRTRAIIPVHLYGQCAEMGAILAIAARRGLRVIEDCAQAHLATHAGRQAGSMGIAGTFSFYPGKNLGAYGDAGAIVTDDEDLARRCRAYANHGALVKHQHEMEGINSRLDGLQAAILSAKLPHLRDWTARRQAVARAYDEALAGIEGVEVPRRRPDTEHVFHLYVIRTRRREALRQYLSERGIDTQVHYPTALPFLPAYQRLGHVPANFPLAHAAQSEILSLPMYAELSLEAVQEVADSIREFHRQA